MVVFTCNNCGDSLQKPKVEKHYQFGCKTFKNLTCVDCLKDFKGQEYEVHIKCITEEQRYSGKAIVPNTLKKGEAKQESWTEMINTLIAETKDINIDYRNLLQSISGCSNVPRKKQKFINYILNTNRRVHMTTIEGVWDLIEKRKGASMNKKTKVMKNEENIVKQRNGGSLIKINENEENTKPTKKNKKKKSKPLCEDDSMQIEDSKSSEEGTDQLEKCKEKFKFEEKIIEILKAKKTISKKKLQKKVLNKYLKHTGLTEISEKHVKKFQKKLKKIDTITIIDDNVML